ncbi:hypothetical protein [methane-oxidizing endosymbiont of Gigantopelta aegis]|uniref:hypothetical protein n=1 Tax=methane-oxidizing endosymbiont of Gigantopelta aegis TaxID=2794938 RepID=UPI0018DD66E4|nr:hypothetical protein [methane-oxidizing endosymbiont of Gigantopelta aegis]
MGEKDIISKQIFKRILVDVATYLFELELDSAELLETEQQRIEDRRADLCARVVDKHQNVFILHLEIQNQNHATMPERMLRYLTDLRLQYPGEEIVQYLLYIGRGPLKMLNGIVTAQLSYRYRVIDMHQKNYRDFLSRNTPDAVVMAILCDFDGDEKRDVVHEVLRSLIKMTQGNHQQLREYIAMLEILATNRNLNLDIQQEYEMLHVEIEKLPSFVMGLEKGIEQGIEKGMEEGMEKGAKKQAYRVASKLLAKGMAVEDIIEITGLSMTEIKTINPDKSL